MDPNNSQEFEAFVPVYDVVPEKWEDAREFLVEHLKKISNAVNSRTIGFLLDEELLSGDQFIPTTAMSGTDSSNSQPFRSVLRKVIVFGALPNTATKAVPHGIIVDSNFSLIHMWASATDPINLLAIPLPFVASPTTNSIQLYMDAINIYITTQDDKSHYTICYVVLEYIQEA